MDKIPFTSLMLIIVILASCSPQEITGNAVNIPPKEFTKEIKVYFCPRDDCVSPLVRILESAQESIHCAFFDIDIKEIEQTLGKKSNDIDVKLVVDNVNKITIQGDGIRKDTSSQYTHNKFCIIDNTIVSTGSMNPTENGALKNNNNLLIFHSHYLAINYEQEFQELWNGNFGEGSKVKYPILYLNNIEIENYFCPEDNCAEKIIQHLRNARRSIHVMAFSFTHEGIADAILFNEKAEIKGITESRGAEGKYSQYPRLRDFGINITKDKSKSSMHHKVFIIDNRTVITGSMNPTNAGNERNDENILIIHNQDIAEKFVQEFKSLYY